MNVEGISKINIIIVFENFVKFFGIIVNVLNLFFLIGVLINL